MSKNRGSKNKKTTNKKICVSCDRSLSIDVNFYLSNNPLHTDGRFPSCKDCVRRLIDYTDLQTILNVLMQMNRPYISEMWERSLNEAERRNRDIFGTYYKNIILSNRDMEWSQGDVVGKNNNKESIKTIDEDIPVKNNRNYGFTITAEIVSRWGGNYEVEEYMKLEKFYHEMKNMNKIETPQEEEYLKKLAVISLKMDQELERGNYQQVKQLGDLFSKYMQDSQLRAIDKTEADKTGGIRNFGTIFAEVEKDGHIPPWETYRKIKGLTQDIIDKTIMHIENFTLRLNKIERMTEPPVDTPKLTEEDTDIFDGDA